MPVTPELFFHFMDRDVKLSSLDDAKSLHVKTPTILVITKEHEWRNATT
jgi:hypothetical protein